MTIEEWAKDFKSYVNALDMPRDDYNGIMEYIDDALSLLKAQKPYKKGYWKYPQSLDCCCSECGNRPDHESGEPVPLYNYCPYCGAEMTVKWEWE